MRKTKRSKKKKLQRISTLSISTVAFSLSFFFFVLHFFFCVGSVVRYFIHWIKLRYEYGRVIKLLVFWWVRCAYRFCDLIGICYDQRRWRRRRRRRKKTVSFKMLLDARFFTSSVCDNAQTFFCWYFYEEFFFSLFSFRFFLFCLFNEAPVFWQFQTFSK